MKILVTGAAGFIGSHIADAYIAEGHDVVVLDNLSTGKKENIPQGAKFIEADLRSPEIADIIGQEKPDIINHHAAQASVRIATESPALDAEINIIGGINLYEAAAKSGVRKIVFASTGGAIYGEQKYFPADEKHSKRPCSPYGVAKLSNEKYLGYYESEYGMEYTIFRYTNVYGPRQNPHGEAGVIAIFIDKLLSREQPFVNGDGTQTRDYVYIDDVVRANVLALEDEMNGIYNVATEMECSVNTLYELLRLKTGIPTPRKHRPAKSGEQMRSCCSYQKLASMHGWKPQVPLELGLSKTIDWFRSQR